MASMHGDPIPAEGQGNSRGHRARHFRPPRIRKHPSWELHRDRITQLYSVENKSLIDIQSMMESEHNFYASIILYRFWIGQWHLERNSTVVGKADEEVPKTNPLSQAELETRKSAVIPVKYADRKFPCPHCTKRFFRAGDLQRHLCLQTKERSYVCENCHATFSRSDNLARHVKHYCHDPSRASFLLHDQDLLNSKEKALIHVENPNSHLFPAFDQKEDIKKLNAEVLKTWITRRITDILGTGGGLHYPAINRCLKVIEGNEIFDIDLMHKVLNDFLGAKTAAFCEELGELCRSELKKSELNRENFVAQQGLGKGPQSKESEDNDSDLVLLHFSDFQFQKEVRPVLRARMDSTIDCEPAYVCDKFHSRIQFLEADRYAERSSNDSALSDGESTDTGSAWMSDYSGFQLLEEDHPFSLVKPIVVQKGLLAYQNAKQRAQAGLSTSATSGGPNTALGAKQVIPSPPKKRSRNNQDGSEDAGDSEDDEDFTAKRQRTSKRAVGNQPSFACPFAKKDPLKYRGCYPYVLKRVRDVKQHLSRFHQLPIYCPRCTHTFEAEDERDGHIRASPCLIQQHPITFEGVTRAQKILLGQRVSAKMTPSDQWFTIFEILFPGHTPRPKSAYINTELTVELEAFQDLMYSEGPRLISSTIRSIGLDISAIENVEEDSAALLPSAIQDGLQQVFQIWLENMPGSQQESSTSRLTPTGGPSTFPACHGIQESEASGSSSNTLVEDIQGMTATAEPGTSFWECAKYQNHALPKGICSNSENMIADTSALLPANTDQQNSEPIANADVQPMTPYSKMALDFVLIEDTIPVDWEGSENDLWGSGESWNFDAVFDEARGM